MAMTASITGYSAFFSSGLLAPPRKTSPELTPCSPSAFLLSSPLGHSSPRPTGEDEPMDEDGRATTPTPGTSERPPNSTGSNTSTATVTAVSRLRRRRSSLTISTSPATQLKTSASRPVLNTAVVTRTRSGSIVASGPLSDAQGLGVAGGRKRSGSNARASSDTSLMGRLRSGSLGTALRWVSLLACIFAIVG
jgi:cytoskeletal protein RodZ